MAEILQIENLEKELDLAGKVEYSTWLKDWTKTKSSLPQIAVVGEILKGKSEIINKLLGQNILPTGVIPNECTISIKQAEINFIIDENGNEKDITFINSALEENKQVTIGINNSFLSKANIIEFPGITKINSDMEFLALSDIYNCNFVILVLSAEQLLSVTECNFLNYFTKYISPEHILIVVNKIDLISRNEVGKVIEFAEMQFKSRFPKVRYAFLAPIDMQQFFKGDALLGIEAIRVFLIQSVARENSDKQRDYGNILKFIEQKLNEEQEFLKKLEQKSIEEQQNIQKKLNALQELELAKLAGIMLTFQGKKENSIKIITKKIEQEFINMENVLLSQYRSAEDKNDWCTSKMQDSYKTELNNIGQTIDSLVLNQIETDTKWLVDQLQIDDYSSKFDTEGIDVESSNLRKIDSIKPYNIYKKYLLIGLGIGTVTSFYFSKILGVAILTVGTIGRTLINNEFSLREKEQDARIEGSIKTDIANLREEICKSFVKELEDVYTNTLNTLNNKKRESIESQYPTKIHSEDDIKTKIINLTKLISKVEEILSCR